MTRINTNVSSLLAQNRLTRSSGDLQQALTRLSTGLRINAGKDDPAGLIASEALRADMTSIDTAISNSTRANLMIGTADSALGQVSDLLNDVRGLTVEAANEGAMSEEQIEANQLQVDSSLEAINRISQTTTFQGRRLLDGTLDFNTNANTVGSLSDVQVDQANLGSTGQVGVEVDISQAATVAEVANRDGFTANSTASADITLSAGVEMDANNGTGTSLQINAKDLDYADGITVQFNNDTTDTNAVTDVTFDGSTITIHGDFSDDDNNEVAVTNMVDMVNTDDDTKDLFTANELGSGGVFLNADVGNTGTLNEDVLTVESTSNGPDFNGVNVTVTSGSTNDASYDASTKELSIQIKNTGPQDLQTVTDAMNSALGDFTVDASTNSSNFVDASSETVGQTTSTGTTGGVTLKDDLVLSVGGSTGREVFSFEQGASVNQVVSAINLVTDATGVVASYADSESDNPLDALELNSTEYGSKGIVDTEVISEGESGAFRESLENDKARDEGSDVQATVNGITATGDGNTLSINTGTLDLSVTVDDGSSENFQFDITGGGALFQLGPDVVSNQQARLGIQSLNTAKMGGSSGRLYEMASGGSKSLQNDPNTAYEVVSEVISKVATLRGRMGAFQRTTVETNIASLGDTLVNLTEAESSIRDADFAKESSALTRAQILQQSGTSVLSMANSMPQNVLSLLQ